MKSYILPFFSYWTIFDDGRINLKESRINYKVEDLYHWALEKEMYSLPMNSNDCAMHGQEQIIVIDTLDF